MTFQEHLKSLIDSSSSGVDLEYEQAEYKSMLMDASKLFDVFQKVGDSLNLYCQSMSKKVSPGRVLADVSGILKKAGFALQFEDLDLRDCFRGSDELWKLNLLKLSDNLRSDNRHLQATLSGIAVPKIPPVTDSAARDSLRSLSQLIASEHCTPVIGLKSTIHGISYSRLAEPLGSSD